MLCSVLNMLEYEQAQIPCNLVVRIYGYCI